MQSKSSNSFDLYNKTVIVTGSARGNGFAIAKELYEYGANIVIYANHLLRASFPSMQNVAKTILKNKRTSELDNTCMSIKEILELIPGTK